MPFIEEEKYNLMQEDLDNANLKCEKAENELEKVQEEFEHYKRNARPITILFAVLFAVAAGFAYHYMGKSGSGSMSEDEIAALKKTEAVRVIDSIKRAEARIKRGSFSESKEYGGEMASTDDTTTETNETSATTTASNFDTKAATSGLNKSTRGKTIYSVQVGIFSKGRYPLIANKFIPGVIAPTYDDFFKYSLGIFDSVDQAKKLRNELYSIGFEDAFVASYVNGKRQKIHP